MEMKRAYNPERELQMQELHPDIYQAQSMRIQNGREAVRHNNGSMAGEAIHNRVVFEDDPMNNVRDSANQMIDHGWSLHKSLQTRQKHATARAPLYLHQEFGEGGSVRAETLDDHTGDRSTFNTRGRSTATPLLLGQTKKGRLIII
jgi:hypothetical protein